MRAPKGGNGLVFSRGSIASCHIYDSLFSMVCINRLSTGRGTSCGVNCNYDTVDVYQLED